MDARLMIEPAAARAAAALDDRAATTTRLDEAVRDLVAAPRRARFETFRDYFEADRRFHQVVR